MTRGKDSIRLRVLKALLRNRIPLVGGWLRRKAVGGLARNGSSGAVEALAEAVAYGDDKRVHDLTLAVLGELTDPHRIDTICAVWATTRHVSLATLLSEQGWVATAPVEVTVLSALLVGQPEVITAGRPEVVKPLAQASEDADLLLAGRARRTLQRLKHKASQEALCQLLIERDFPSAREAAIAAGYVPRERQQRTLFFFMTEQWERYETLDFDRRLLRTAYEVADSTVRQRIREKLRALGRTDYLTVITGRDYRARVADMQADEIDLLVQMLTANREWPKLWTLVFEVPFNWSVQIMRALVGDSWRPDADEAQPIFERLATMAAQGLTLNETDLSSLFPPALLQARARVPGRINDVTFSPLQPVIAIGTGQRKVVLWNFQRAEREQVLGAFEHSIGHVTFTPDNVLLCAERTNSRDPCAIHSWSDNGLFRLGQHNGSVTAIAPVGPSQALSAGRDYYVVLWDVHAKREIVRKRFHFWARAVRVAPDGQGVALLHKGLALATLPGLKLTVSGSGGPGVARCAAFYPDGQTLVAGQFKGDVIILERTKGGTLRRKRDSLTRHAGRVVGVEALPGRSLIITAGSKGQIQFMGLDDRAAIGTVQAPSTQLTSLHVSPDESFMATGNADASLSLWDLRVMDMRSLLTRPFARAVPARLLTLSTLVNNRNLAPRARLALKFAECVLQYRFRFAIEIEEAPQIKMGEFDIDIE